MTKVEDLQNVREPSSSSDYDGDGNVEEGVAQEIAGLQEILLTSIQTYAKEVAGAEIKYDAATYPYFMGADGKAYTSWTPRLLKAAYNYQVSVKDPGAFAHGGKYIIELIFDSIEDVNASEKLTTKFDVTTIAREDPGHFNGARQTWRHWDEASDTKAAYTVEAGCVKCHSAAGLPQFLSGAELTEQPAGNGLMCVTCHDVQAGFPARFAVKDVTLPSGKVVSYGENADSNLCIQCHQGRASKVTLDKMIEQFAVADKGDEVVAPITVDGKEVKFSFKNAHYLGIAAMWFGTDAQGFYEFEGKTYVGTNPHVPVDNKPGCVGCHDAHNGTPKEELCKTCHGETPVDDIRGMSSTADFNGNGDTKEGIRQEYRLLRDALYAEIQAYAKAKTGTGIVYDTNTYPYWFADADGDGKADQKDGANVSFSSWTPNLMKAAYNFNFMRKNPGAGVHNAKYAIQILIDSIEALGGDISKYVRP